MPLSMDRRKRASVRPHGYTQAITAHDAQVIQEAMSLSTFAVFSVLVLKEKLR